ncbi:Peptidase C2 calpain catalytic domain [Trinorchestia longiramus]|nr:Peptidase C2 calpain catalytic domain [Trinorchestia longiramus]
MSTKQEITQQQQRAINESGVDIDVIRPDQILHGDGYKGLIVCRFWRFGNWATVCIDDRLPTKDGKLLFARSSEDAEFWAALLEKAYAKLHGSYEAMEGGQSMDALVDLTGGLAERYDFDENADLPKIFKQIYKQSRNGAFVTCSRKGDWRMAYKTDENGLVEGHAYTVTAVTRVKHDSLGVVNLVRIRNPWANEAEWKGTWRDNDPVWAGVSERQRQKLRKHEEHGDGESWISYDDFAKQFEEVSVCMIGPDFDGDGDVDRVEKTREIEGSWRAGVNAGGSRNNFDLFSTNPQILLHIMDTGKKLLKALILQHLSDLRSDEDALLELSRTQSWEQSAQVLEGNATFVHGLYEIFHQAKLDAKRRKKHLVHVHLEIFLDTVCSPGTKVVLLYRVSQKNVLIL